MGAPMETVRSRLRIGIGRLRALHAGERGPRKGDGRGTGGAR